MPVLPYQINTMESLKYYFTDNWSGFIDDEFSIFMFIYRNYLTKAILITKSDLTITIKATAHMQINRLNI